MSVIIKRADGGVSVSSFEGTEEERQAFLGKWAQSAKPEWLPATIEAFDGVFPVKDEFRDAWGHDLKVDIVKAREITKSRLRRERAPLMADLDAQFMRALEAGTATASIAAEKQRLRDLPQSVDGMLTLDEMRAVRA